MKILEFGNIKQYDFYIFEILIHNSCDFKCSYCYMRNEHDNWNTSAKFLNIYEIFKILKKINNFFNLRICLSGGEALLHNQIFNIINLFQKLFDFELHINTNLGESFENLKQIKYKYPNLNIILHSSIHPTQINLKNLEEKIQFIEDNFICEYNYMIDPKINSKTHFQNLQNLRSLIIKNNLYLKGVYINSKFKFYKSLQFDKEKINWLKKNINKEYYAILENNQKILLNDIDIYEKFNLPFSFQNYICNYLFFTIDAFNFRIKQMCENFNIKDIRKDYQFFIKYAKNPKIICPHKECLWPSALDMKKELKCSIINQK